MARKIVQYTIEAEGRDRGKVFELTEMSARATEKWAARAFLALARSGVNIPPEIEALGWAGIATVGLTALSRVTYEDVEPLMADMMECVTVVPDPTRPTFTRALVEDDTEEVATLVELRREVFKLHADFSKVAAWWKARTATKEPPALDTLTSPN